VRVQFQRKNITKSVATNGTFGRTTGAGASVAFGMPVTARILPRALAGSRVEAGPDFSSVARAGGIDEDFFAESLRAPYPGICLQGSEDDLAGALPGITDVLSFLDLLIGIGRKHQRRRALFATTGIWYLRNKEHNEHKPSCVDSHYFEFWANCSVAP
jgi:hypothetical protein